jgi:FixJ family two-component response regulator
MSNPVVHIVEDDAAVCDSLSLLCETAGLAARCYESPEVFLASDWEAMHGCIILDVRLPRMSGLQLHEELRRRGCRLPIVYLTAHGDIPMTVRAMKLGAIDFLTKPVNATAFVERVRAIVQENTAPRLAATSAAAARLATLTGREREVMRLAVDGYSNKEIGRRLAISFRTVEIHRSRIMRKTACANLLELVRLVAATSSPSGGEAAQPGSENSGTPDAL